MNLPLHIYDGSALKGRGYWFGSFCFLSPSVASIPSGSIVKTRINSLFAVRHNERKGA